MDYKQIVIGFSEAQRGDAESICAMLAKEEVSVFMAEGTLVDDMSDAELHTVIDNCRALVLLLSEDTQSHGFVTKVLRKAMDLQKLIIPIKLIDFEYNATVGPYLSNVQQIFAYKDKESEIANVVKQLSDFVYARDENPYSLRSFIGKMLSSKLHKTAKKMEEAFKRLKSRFAKIHFTNKLPTLICFFVALGTALFIYLGIRSSWRLTQSDIGIVTGIPLLVGVFLALVFSLLLHIVRNKVVAILLSLVFSALIFVAMMMTGFFISQNII